MPTSRLLLLSASPTLLKPPPWKMMRMRGRANKGVSLPSTPTASLELSEKSENRKRNNKSPGNSVYLLLLTNLAVFAADHWLKVDGVKSLYLYHGSPKWYQFITSTLCHGNWSHISSNLFFIYIFGKLVEEEEGGLALWLCYFVTGAGANLVSWLLLPPSIVSVGASGAVFGLFAISVLVKVSWDWRKLLEVLILGQFVMDKVMEATRLAQQQVSNVNHIAHCAGALIGVLLIWLISKIPSDDSDTRKKQEKRV